MPINTIYALGQSQITVSGGGQLSGITQGDGSHLAGRTITLNSNAWTAMSINDNESNFDDSDVNQVLNGAQSFDGTSYASGLRVEAEYSITVQDSAGNQYVLLAFNINEGGPGPAYGTVEGLAFVGGVGGFPPRGEPLTVLSTAEGPSRPIVDLATPPCFTAGTRIGTPGGPVPIEDLAPGDMVLTLDHGPQPLRWIGRTYLPQAVLARNPGFRPVTVARDAFGPGRPCRDMRLSPQHRVLITDWRAQYFFGEPEVLVPIKKLVNDGTIRVAGDGGEVTYFHLLFDRHEIVWSDGLPSESYLPEAATAAAPATRDEVLDLFPDLRGDPAQTARSCVSDKRALVFRPRAVA